MSGASINKKLQKAFQKVGKIMGFKFFIYRSVDYLTPIQTKNLIGTQTVGFALDENFKAQIQENYKRFNLFFDTTNFKIGDVFVSDEANKTFVLVNKDPIVSPQAIEATHKITISRPEYSTAGGFKSTSVEIAKDVPAAIFEIGSSSSGSAIGETQNKSGVRRFSIWIWLPQGSVKMNDVIEDNFGNKSYISSIEFSSVGYKLTAQSTKVGS